MRIYDLSLPIDEDAPEPFTVRIDRISHAEGPDKIGRKVVCGKDEGFISRLKKLALYYTGRRRIGRESFPGGMFISHETVRASVHCGTHVDSPYHFGPESEGKASRDIEALPLEWFYGDGVVLDFTSREPGGEITPGDIEAELARIAYRVKGGDIVLFRTGADKYFGTPRYFSAYPGASAAAVEYLIAKGIKVMGTDAPGFDRPTGAMVEDYYKSGNKEKLWPAHMYGRKREYCHIERLANLGTLPRPHGFRFACFPVKIKGVGAAWSRAAAIFEDME